MDGLQNNPLLHRYLFFDDVAKDATLFALKVFQGSQDLFINPSWDGRHGHNMGVGMAIENPWIILQNKELLKSSIPLQIDESFPIGKEYLLDLRGSMVARF